MRKKPGPVIVALITGLSIFVVKSVSPQQVPSYLALITGMTGEVMVKKAGSIEFEKALWGMQLYPGDRLTTLETSEVSLLFSNNNLLALGPNSSLTISEGPVALNESPKPVRSIDRELLADLWSLTLRRTSEGEIGVLAGLRFGAFEEVTVLLSPRNSKIKGTRPSWHPP